MSKSLRWSTALSAALHAGLAYYFLKPFPLALEEKVVLEVEYKEQPSGSPSGGNRRHGKGRGIALKNLIPKFDAYSSGDKLQAEGNLGLEDEEWGSHGGRLGEIENFDKLQRLFVEVSGLLSYPSKLGLRGMGDTVNSRLYFDDSSQCDWKRIKISASNPYFRVYTLALLKKLCSFRENMAAMQFNHKLFADLSFAFLVLGKLEDPGARVPDVIQGNVLLFRRTFLRPSLHYELGPFEGDPLFGNIVSINFPWIFEHWDLWVNGRDPLQEFK